MEKKQDVNKGEHAITNKDEVKDGDAHRLVMSSIVHIMYRMCDMSSRARSAIEVDDIAIIVEVRTGSTVGLLCIFVKATFLPLKDSTYSMWHVRYLVIVLLYFL